MTGDVLAATDLSQVALKTLGPAAAENNITDEGMSQDITVDQNEGVSETVVFLTPIREHLKIL